LVALHQNVGNRAFTAATAPLRIQRHEGPTTNEEANAAGSNPATAESAGTEAAGGASTTDTAAASASTAQTSGASATGQEAAGQEAAGQEAAGSGATQTAAGNQSEVQPGTGTTGTGTTGTSGLTGAARTKAIEDTLRASNTGTWALGIVEKWKVPVDYEYGGQGSYHQGGRIYINKTLGIGAAAVTLMHEAQHADTYKSGKGADIAKLSRDEYITKSIADEAEAVVRQIEGLAVTTGLGVDMTGNPITPALKDRYLKAFYKKRDELKAANPSMSTADINAACRTATRDGEVTNWFADGTFVTSTNNNSYKVFYGNQWDDAHKTPGS
jgi:hypothetical protein